MRLKSDKNEIYLMTNTCVKSRDVFLSLKNVPYTGKYCQAHPRNMITQVNRSLLRTGNKKHTTSFLRCRGVL